MNQREAVIKTMELNGGYATLGFLYENVLKFSEVTWETKTPFASIRRIVQNKKYFFKIRPGLWALNTHRNKIPFVEENSPKANESSEGEFSHSYFQGILTEIGNLKSFETFIPYQDQNKKFLDKPLKTIASLSKFHEFSYQNIIDIAKTIDVVWFNNRKFPTTFIEVEHSTNFINSLLKFVDLQDFYSSFWIVSPENRKKDFLNKISRTGFQDIKSRVKFISYEAAAQLHQGVVQQKIAENLII